MSIMAERELTCFLCLKHFSGMHADCILGPEIICDDCQAELGALPETERQARVSVLLAQRGVTAPDTIAFVLQVLRRP